MRQRLVVFAKAPRMGRAKTRLARDVGLVHAQRLYRAMTAKVLRAVQDPRWDTVLAATPEGAWDAAWDGAELTGQGGGDLGARLARAMGVPGPVCVIGTDCPEVEAQDIAAAFRALRGAELVLGPAGDGGFWLITARGPVGAELFKDVRWSGETALADVAANVEGEVAYLRELVDVDDAAALREVRARGVRV